MTKLCGGGLGSLALLGCIVGCDGGGPSTQAVRGDLSTAAKITYQGRSYTWVRAVPQSGSLGAASRPTTIQDPSVSIDPNVEAKYQTYLKGLTDAEYGEKLRITLLLNGNQYIADEPPTEEEIVAARQNAGVHSAPGSQPTATQALSGSVTSGAPLVSPASFTDNRQVVQYNTYPGTPHVVLRFDCIPAQQNCTTDCSAVLIGPNTAATAAHCFWSVPDQQWRHFQYGATGEDDLQQPNVAGSTFSNCFGVSMPTAYLTDPSTTSQWDFAQMNFVGCSDNPAPRAGYLGYWQNLNLPANGVVWEIGYPAFAAHCTYAEVCGMAGTATKSGALWLSTNIFNSGGESGGSTMYVTGGNDYWIGDVLAVSPTTSYMRRFDSTVYPLFHAADPVRFP